MLFLDDFLEMLEELPTELRERCCELRAMDAAIKEGLERNRLESTMFFNQAAGMTPEVRQEVQSRLIREMERLARESEKKVKIAEGMQALLEKYAQHLEKEKLHFKYELEADNPGVTEGIEKRFSDYCEQAIAMRKERRKRRHSNSMSNGNGVEAVENLSVPTSSISRNSNGTFLPRGSHPPPAKLSRQASMTPDREAPITPSATLPAVPRGRKPSQLVSADDSSKDIRRDAIRAQLQSALSLKTSASERTLSGMLSPGLGEGRSPRHTPFSGGGTLSPADKDRQFTYPSSSPRHSTPAPSTPSPVTASSTMPNFIGSESRHGRPRKLTSRAQEMFNAQAASLASHRESRTPRHMHNASSTPAFSPASSEDRMSTTQSHSRHGPGGDHDDDTDEKPYCFCHEKSYGDMVACDNKDCPFEWFHLPCIGLESAPKGKWFCPHCTQQAHIQAERRRGSRQGSQSLQ